jgi:hypothetical protein
MARLTYFILLAQMLFATSRSKPGAYTGISSIGIVQPNRILDLRF